MAIVFEHGIEVSQSPSEVFVFLDDFKKVPLWLKRCEGVAKEGHGPNKAGDKLRYAYREGGHHGVMDGHVVAHEPHSLLSYHYYDAMMSVQVDFRMTPLDGADGTRLVHRIELKPHSFMAKLMSPMFKSTIAGQTKLAMENVRRLLAEETAAARVNS